MASKGKKDSKKATVADLRKQYRRALLGLCYDNANVPEINNAVKQLLLAEGNPTPEDFVATIESLLVLCRRCAGTGQFITGTTNGKPTGPGGICFRCEGKGSQTHRDGHRNRVHDDHYFGRGF